MIRARVSALSKRHGDRGTEHARDTERERGREAERVLRVSGCRYNFDGAKAYKDSKLCLMMTSNTLHDKYHKQTGIAFSSIYPGSPPIPEAGSRGDGARGQQDLERGCVGL